MIRLGKFTDYGLVLMSVIARQGRRAGSAHRARSGGPVQAAAAHREQAIEGTCCKADCWSRIAASRVATAWRARRRRFPWPKSSRPSKGRSALTECSTDVTGICDLEPSCPIKMNQRMISQVVRGALEKVDARRPDSAAATDRY